MIRDLRRERPSTDDRAQVCVVGAGAAGITLALELARRGRTVVMLEAGGRDVEQGEQDPYRSEVAGQEHRGIHTGRFRALGGTTQRWGGQILELDAGDFESRPWVKGSGWPFAKSELAPFYPRALAIEGVAASLSNDEEVWRTLGLQPPAFGEMEPYFTRWCPEPSFARLHGKALEASERLTVWLHASAVGMEMEDGKVSWVWACSRDESGVVAEVVFRAEAFVFCLGAIECARFFLQPREGGLPWNRSGLLGKHFQDHIDVNVATLQPRSRKRFAELFDNVFLQGYKYHPKLRLAPGVQARTGSLNCALTVTFTSEKDSELQGLKTTARHLLRGRWGQVGMADGRRMLREAPLLWRQSWRYAREHRMFNPPDAEVRLRVHCEQEPEGASSITLAGERDSLGMLRTRLDWQIAQRELATVREIAGVAARALADVADVQVWPQLEDDEALRGRCDDSNHHMGGMRMAASETSGVVSPDLRVHGTSNAYVCSGAVFPSSGFSNPTHTVIALALRLADRLHVQLEPQLDTRLSKTPESVRTPGELTQHHEAPVEQVVWSAVV